jgi:hypothetical protein
VRLVFDPGGLIKFYAINKKYSILSFFLSFDVGDSGYKFEIEFS